MGKDLEHNQSFGLKGTIMKNLCLLVLLLAGNRSVFSQEKKEFSDAIEDNSYFIEEAYNQEYRVVQHINNMYLTTSPTRNLGYSFTQEWPFFSDKHQLSYTIQYSWLNSNSVNGIGDMLINYRYQLFTKENWAAVSPRLSVIIPTGNSDKGLGSGRLGWQLNIPVSKRISNGLAVHFNAGGTILPGVKFTDDSGQDYKQTLHSINVGGSAIWLLTQNFNFMLEYLSTFNYQPDGMRKMSYNHTGLLNPGIRYAINIDKLQIVPGLSVPYVFSKDDHSFNLFFYLSFEHPF